MAFGLSAGAVGLIAGGLGAAAGVYSANKNADAMESSNAAQIEANKLDPRVTGMLYGPDGTTGQGLIDRYKGLLDQPQMAGQAIYGQAGDNYVGKFGAYDMEQQRDAANKLMGGGMLAPLVKAPSQNEIDLKPAYERFINGAPGANPFLTKAIGSGIDMSKAAFTQAQDDSTKNLMEKVLPSIRSNAVIAGQYGGSRQGVAEGNAIGDFQTEQQRSLTNFGLGNTKAGVDAQAGAYETDQNRALSATQDLSGKQYGTAHANNAAIMDTNRLNSANMVAGIGANSGILAGAYGVAGNQDQYDLNKAGSVNGLLQPYLSKNPVPTTLQPTYGSTAGAALGGAAAGLGLWNQYQQMQTPKPSSWDTRTAGYSAGTGY
jgi:hypothetical protein